MKIYVLNGPNLGRLGTREPEIYGERSLGDIEEMCHGRGEDKGAEIDFRQTDHEDELISWLREAASGADGVIVNPGAFTHYSHAVADAVADCEIPVVEVHLSNIYAREPWRARSVVSRVVRGVIAGFGPEGYVLAIEALAAMSEDA